MELIYLPEPSWQPALIAFGIAGVLAGVLVWWPYGAVGAVVALLALRAWVAASREQFGRLPRRQQVSTAVIPAVSLRKPE